MNGEQMEFPNTFDEFAKDYGFKDKDEIYSNGIELIPVFRVKQWLEHIKNTTQMIDKSNFDIEQYHADLQSAYNCGMNVKLEDIKVEIQNTILLQAYEKGQNDALEKIKAIKAEIKEWYWRSDKQELAKDPCVVDAMTDLFIRTIDKHIKENKE